MFKILSKQVLNQQIKRIDISAPGITSKWMPGQFIVLMVKSTSRRVAFNCFDINTQKNALSLYVHESDCFAEDIDELKIGDDVFAIAGPFGQGIAMSKLGHVLCISENKQIAANLPIARAFKEAGNKVLAIADFAKKQSKFLEPQMRMATHSVFMTSDADMYESSNSLAVRLNEILSKNDIAHVYVDGSLHFILSIQDIMTHMNIPTYGNLIAYLNAMGNVFDATEVFDENNMIAPCIDGTIVNLNDWNLSYLQKRLSAWQEYKECQNKTSSHKSLKSESGIFPKLFAGLVKSKP